MQAEKGSDKSSPDGKAKGKGQKDKMPRIPKTEPSEAPQKGSAEKPGKAAQGAARKKGAAGKAEAKAAKEAEANGKAGKAAAVKKERKVFELPGQTRDTPPEV